MPAPPDETVLGHVVEQRGHVLPAVARGILDLLADRAERLALPRHRARRQMPLGVTRHVPLGIKNRSSFVNESNHHVGAQLLTFPCPPSAFSAGGDLADAVGVSARTGVWG